MPAYNSEHSHPLCYRIGYFPWREKSSAKTRMLREKSNIPLEPARPPSPVLNSEQANPSFLPPESPSHIKVKLISSISPRSIRPEQALFSNLSATINARPDGVKENAYDSTVPKTLDSPKSRPVSRDPPILPARQKTTLEKKTGYGRGDLGRERPESEPGPRQA